MEGFQAIELEKCKNDLMKLKCKISDELWVDLMIEYSNISFRFSSTATAMYDKCLLVDVHAIFRHHFKSNFKSPL